MIKIGIAGTGSTYGIADYHLKAFLRLPKIQVAAVFTRRKEMGENFVRKYGLDAAVCESYEELLARVDGVCICTPNYLHASMALKALRAGKGVLCEKPMFGTDEEIQELWQEAKSRSFGHLAGFNYRYEPENQKLKELISEGRLGRMYTFYQRKGGNRLANKNIPYEWRMDRRVSKMGAAIDFGSHLLDNFLYIGGYEPEMISSVAAQAETFVKERADETGTERDVDTDDMSMLTVRTCDGAMGRFDCSRLGVTYEEIQIVGSEGMAYYTALTPGRIYLWGKRRDGSMENEPGILEWEEKEDTYYLQAKAWVESMKEETSVQPDLELACRQELIFRAFQRAAEEKREILLGEG